jgi:hypothetical protein
VVMAKRLTAYQQQCIVRNYSTLSHRYVMHALRIATAPLQKVFPHLICVKFFPQEDCNHKTRLAEGNYWQKNTAGFSLIPKTRKIFRSAFCFKRNSLAKNNKTVH